MSIQSAIINDYSVYHGGIRTAEHPELGTILGQTAIRYMRFFRSIKLDRLELGLKRLREQPNVPTHPAHLLISVLDPLTNTWHLVKEVELPFNPRIAGEGLSQDMSIEEMESHLEPIFDEPPHTIELGGIVTDHLRIECDLEHPVWANHAEYNGGELIVPFAILQPLNAFGIPQFDKLTKSPYNPILLRKEISPKAPEGMRVRDLPNMLLFEGEQFSVGFSLRRPLLMHLGWDIFGEPGNSRSSCNMLFTKGKQHNTFKPLYETAMSGPSMRGIDLDLWTQSWTGEVRVIGNRVIYTNIKAIDGGVSIDAIFTVESDRLIMELTQTCDREIPIIETEAWRLTFDIKTSVTGIAGLPSLRPGRNGDTKLPVIIAGSNGAGGLSCRLVGEQGCSTIQVESCRNMNCVSAGFSFKEFSANGSQPCEVIPKGTRRSTYEFVLANLEPEVSDGAVEEVPTCLKEHWGTIFSCFRPEYRGFSNNSISSNCHLSQGPPIEIVAHTKKPDVGPSPIELGRYTIERALLGGGGYGDHRNLFMDSDPVLISAAGCLHQAERDLRWLAVIKPGLILAVKRMLKNIGDEKLLICQNLSGNTGSFRWSSNAMDVVGFGHIDAYVNALSYRAFRNATAMLEDLECYDLSATCRKAADGIRKSYAGQLLNPKTGWVAGWKSRDGELHDYAFTWVNGVATAFGLLDPDDAKKALKKLEKLRDEVGPGTARMGLPLNLLPITDDDQMLTKILPPTKPTFQIYTNGGLSGWPSTYYLRALSIYGLKEEATRLADELGDGLVNGMFTGGNGAGGEFRSWDGLPTGYEGTLIGCLGPVYGIAIEKGVFKPHDPEWWPVNG